MTCLSGSTRSVYAESLAPLQESCTRVFLLSFPASSAGREVIRINAGAPGIFPMLQNHHYLQEARPELIHLFNLPYKSGAKNPRPLDHLGQKLDPSITLLRLQRRLLFTD